MQPTKSAKSNESLRAPEKNRDGAEKNSRLAKSLPLWNHFRSLFKNVLAFTRSTTTNPRIRLDPRRRFIVRNRRPNVFASDRSDSHRTHDQSSRRYTHSHRPDARAVGFVRGETRVGPWRYGTRIKIARQKTWARVGFRRSTYRRPCARTDLASVHYVCGEV